MRSCSSPFLATLFQVLEDTCGTKWKVAYIYGTSRLKLLMSLRSNGWPQELVRVNAVAVITGTRSMECPPEGLVKRSTEYYSVH